MCVQATLWRSLAAMGGERWATSWRGKRNPVAAVEMCGSHLPRRQNLLMSHEECRQLTDSRCSPFQVYCSIGAKATLSPASLGQ